MHTTGYPTHRTALSLLLRRGCWLPLFDGRWSSSDSENNLHYGVATNGQCGRSQGGSRRWLGKIVGILLLSFVGDGWIGLAEEPVDPRRPAAVETGEVPVIPGEIFERLRQYRSVREASFAGWAPDGDGMLIRTRFGNSAQLHRVYQPGGRREQITFFEEPVSGRFVPRSNAGNLICLMSQGGNENDQIYLLDRTAYQTRLLTDGKSRNLLGPVSLDGSQFIFSSNRRNGRDMDIYLADLAQETSPQLVFPVENAFWYAADWSQDRQYLLLGRYVSINESYFALLDLKTGHRTDLSLPDGQIGAIGDMRFSPDGKTIYLSTDVGSEFRRLARYDIASGKYTWLTTNLDWDVSGIEVDPHTGNVAFTVNEDGASSLYLYEREQVRQVNIPLGIVSGVEFSPDSQQLGFSLARPDSPADAYSLSLADGKLIRWTFSEVGGLDPSRFVTPERIQFRSFDGRMIPAYYYRPRTASPDHPAPVLVQIHGGPESQYRPYFSGSIQYYVNDLGMAVIAPNVRGSAGYGKTYLKLDNAELREDSVRDIGGLLDWIASRDELAANRVAVMGGSYGGYMVLASLVHYSERIAAGIDIVGIASFTTFLKNTAAYRQDLRRAEYGDERDPRMQAVFERINPTANANRIQSALLVAHGKNDPRVPFSEAEQIAAIVRQQGKPVWTVYAANEGHGFAKKDNADYLSAVEVQFLIQEVIRKGQKEKQD